MRTVIACCLPLRSCEPCLRFFKKLANDKHYASISNTLFFTSRGEEGHLAAELIDAGLVSRHESGGIGINSRGLRCIVPALEVQKPFRLFAKRQTENQEHASVLELLMALSKAGWADKPYPDARPEPYTRTSPKHFYRLKTRTSKNISREYLLALLVVDSRLAEGLPKLHHCQLDGYYKLVRLADASMLPHIDPHRTHDFYMQQLRAMGIAPQHGRGAVQDDLVPDVDVLDMVPDEDVPMDDAGSLADDEACMCLPACGMRWCSSHGLFAQEPNLPEDVDEDMPEQHEPGNVFRTVGFCFPLRYTDCVSHHVILQGSLLLAMLQMNLPMWQPGVLVQCMTMKSHLWQGELLSLFELAFGKAEHP